jgi:hypothetical protein
MRLIALSFVMALLSYAGSQSISAPILSTENPPFPIKACHKSATSIPFEAVPDFLKGKSALLEAYLASENQKYAEQHSTLSGAKEKTFPSFAGIAGSYEKWCSAYGIRWDMAFIQMLHETNFLRYTGSVQPNSFNFAGLSALHENSGGERFADLQRGVKAHCQHLAAYALIDLPSKKCGVSDLANLGCIEADRTLAVKDAVIRGNVCKQFGRPARFDELGPDDVGPCSERQVFLRGQRMTEKLCPNDIVRWATGPLATGYSGTLNKMYSRFLEKIEHCKSVTATETGNNRDSNQQEVAFERVRCCVSSQIVEAEKLCTRQPQHD